MQWKAKTKMAKDRIHSASKPDPTTDHPKRMPDLEKEKKNRGKDALEFEARRFRSYPNWLSISARLSTKPCYRLIFLKKNAFCLSVKAKNELRLLFPRDPTHITDISPPFPWKIDSASFCKACCQMTAILFHPTPPILCPISNHSLSISRKTLVGFSPIPKPTSIPSADFHPKSLANIIVCSPRNDAWRRLRSLLNRSQPCQWDASKESPYDQTPKASIPWEDGRWARDMDAVCLCIPQDGYSTFNIHETSVHWYHEYIISKIHCLRMYNCA